jgi:nucleotide-binding universal stress UspA family protein
MSEAAHPRQVDRQQPTDRGALQQEPAMTKMLVPFDGSEGALHALRHAMEQAAEIHVLNVQPKADAPTLLLHMTQDDIDKAQHDHGRSQLAEAIKRLDDTKASYRAQVVIGDPAVKIFEVAKSEGVDGIVMGTRGMGALGNLVLGSVATKVVHLAEVPVTLVK